MTRHFSVSRPRLLLTTLLSLVATTACSDSSGPGDLEGIAFLVGDWDADVLVATSITNPAESDDLIARGASFRINVQPSGQYTAVLTFIATPLTEIGQAELDGNRLTLYREFPSPDTSVATLTQLSADRIRLLGESSYDFDFGGPRPSEPVELVTELQRR